MSSKLVNKYGVITIDNEAIMRIAGQAVMECAGVVGMAAKNARDGFVQLLKKENLTKGVFLTFENGELNIGLHIIVEYGTNITAVTETILQNVRYKVGELAGLGVGRVNISVEGVRTD